MPLSSTTPVPLAELESELLGLAGHIAAAQSRFLVLLAEFDDRGGWAGPGLRSCAHWLSWRAGMSLRTATEQVRVAHALTRLPLVAAAFAAGSLSYSKVRAITRVAVPDACPASTVGSSPAAAHWARPRSAEGGAAAQGSAERVCAVMVSPGPVVDTPVSAEREGIAAGVGATPISLGREAAAPGPAQPDETAAPSAERAGAAPVFPGGEADTLGPAEREGIASRSAQRGGTAPIPLGPEADRPGPARPAGATARSAERADVVRVSPGREADLPDPAQPEGAVAARSAEHADAVLDAPERGADAPDSWERELAALRSAERGTAHPVVVGPAAPGADPLPAGPTSEKVLLDLALAGTASHVERVVRAARRLAAGAEVQTARRSVSWRWDEDGMLVLRARLDPAAGAALLAALDEATGPTTSRRSHDDPPAPPDVLERGAEEAPGAAADGTAARRADALVELVTRETGPGPSVARGRAEFVVHVDLTAVGAPVGAVPVGAAPVGAAQGGAAPVGAAPGGVAPGGAAPSAATQGGMAPVGATVGGVAPVGAALCGAAQGGAAQGGAAQGGTAQGGAAPVGAALGGVALGGPSGPELPAATARRLACDARARVLLSGGPGERLYLGRRRRLASPAQIAALTVRDDGRCRFPGCTHQRYLHAHHVRSWLDGGRTDLDNLVLLCGFHHRLVHDRGYGIRADVDGWRFSRPDGTPVPAAGAPLHGSARDLVESHVRAGLRIGPGNLTPTWFGERLDPNPILEVLVPALRTARAA
jgi:hypothetical protein